MELKRNYDVYSIPCITIIVSGWVLFQLTYATIWFVNKNKQKANDFPCAMQTKLQHTFSLVLAGKAIGHDGWQQFPVHEAECIFVCINIHIIYKTKIH